MIEVNPNRAAFLVIDVQPTFMPGGELPVDEGDTIVAPGRRLLERLAEVPAIATQDWHPPGHLSFASSHPGTKPFDCVELHGESQVLWPDHAVQGSAAAGIHPGLPLDRFLLILRKGIRVDTDSYMHSARITARAALVPRLDWRASCTNAVLDIS